MTESPAPSTLGDRLAGSIVSFISGLPPPLLRLLAGGRPVRVDGQELAAEAQLGLRLLALSGQRGLDGMTPAAARIETVKRARAFAGVPIAIASISEERIPGPSGTIPARLYIPSDDGRRRPLIVFYHGGGWVVGDLDTHDPLCRFLAREVDAAVLSVAYRLAPEHRFPAAIEDALAAFDWATRRAAALGVDRERIAVAGDSAGGNLAAVVSQLAVRTGGQPPAAQLLIYPATDMSTRRESYRLFAEGFFLTAKEVDWFTGHYFPDQAAARDPRVSPLLAENLRGLPPAVVVTAGFDVLRDEGEAYARRMEAAGVQVVLRRQVGLIHGFANTTGVSPASRAAVGEAAKLLRDLLGAT